MGRDELPAKRMSSLQRLDGLPCIEQKRCGERGRQAFGILQNSPPLRHPLALVPVRTPDDEITNGQERSFGRVRHLPRLFRRERAATD